MKRKPRGNRVMTLIIVFICVALVFAALWGIVTGIAKLMHYGDNTTIHQEEAEPEEVQTEVPVEEEAVLPKNSYSADGFYTIDGIRYYHGGDWEGVPGVDVSSYQPTIDWEAVKASGIEFAMIRVGYRGYVSGELVLDETFLQNMEGAVNAGLDVGVYFFSQALNVEEAVEEAEFVLEQLEGRSLQYPIVFDWEEVQANARTDEMNMLMLTSCALAFCLTVEEAGYEGGIYFNQAYGYSQLNLVSLQDFEFWLAEYDEFPSFAYDFQMWQYTDSGTVPGIEGPVDLNVAFRKRAE